MKQHKSSHKKNPSPIIPSAGPTGSPSINSYQDIISLVESMALIFTQCKNDTDRNNVMISNMNAINAYRNTPGNLTPEQAKVVGDLMDLGVWGLPHFWSVFIDDPQSRREEFKTTIIPVFVTALKEHA